jgi:broad-specificity NMP kinase
MKKTILITGVSGTGKTALSEMLNSKSCVALDIDDIEGLFTMFDKITKQPMINQDNDDLEKVKNMNWVCDVEKLKNIIAKQDCDLVFCCGNAGNMNEIIPLFNAVMLLTASPEKIRERLSSRVFNDFGKNKQIQDWLLSFKESWENDIKSKGAICVDTNKNLDQVATEIIEQAKKFF